MADELYVLNEGTTIPTDFTATVSAGTFNIKTGVNPIAISKSSTASTTLGINCYEVHSDDTSSMGSGTVTSSKLNRLFPVSTTVADYADNIIENHGYRVTIDTGNASGLTLADTKDYFVVIYADNVKKHHVAKIEEQTQYDGNNYHFEFTPRLKENITAGTKVAIYQGPDKTDNIVAVGYGLLNDVDVSDTVTTSTSPDNIRVSSTNISSSLSVGDTIISSDFAGGTTITAIDGRDITPSTSPTTSASGRSIVFAREERHDKYVEISRPTFYFYSDDKLDHDRKYTLLKTSTNFSGTKKSVFKTAPISSDMIIDKGFFTHHGDLTDNNRANDNLSTPRFINAYNAQGSTYTFDETTWASSSRNIYSSDGGLSTYITFIDSPTKNQIHSSPYYVNVNKTVTNKGNLAEIKFFDTEKILDKKINSYEQFRVKQLIAEKNLDSTANNPLPGTCSKTTSNTFTVSGLVGGEDWRKVMFDGSSAYEPVFIGTYYYTITGITAPSAGSQVVTIGNKRLITSNAFAGSAVLEAMSSAIAYRKTWSPVSQTYIAGHQIDTQISYADAITRNGNTVTSADSDVNGVEYLLENADNEVFLEVEKGDKDTGYTKLTSRPASNFFASKYLNDSISGKLLINNSIFDGFVESRIADVKQAFKYEIVGRDSINKLLNTNLDKNYVHSQEFVYTTFSPYVGDNTSNTELESVPLVVSSISGKVITTIQNPTTRLSYGDTIAFELNDDRYVVLGVVESTTSSPNTVTLMKDCYISDLTNKGSTTLGINSIYRIRKSIIPSKNLETTPRITNRATSLAGTLDKGIVFGSGREFSSTGDTNLLIQTKETNVENGYNIDDLLTPIVNSDGEYLDFPLGFKTTLNIPASTPEMEIISSLNNPNGTVSYELGYVSPIVLGMVTRNTNDFFIDSYPNIRTQPIRLINGQGLPDGGFLHLLSSYKNSDNSPKTFNNIFSDDPAYGSTVKSQYAFRYNQPIFRYANMVKTPEQLILQPYSHKYHKGSSSRFESNEYTSSNYSRNDYYENTKNINFYLSSYKITKQNIDYDKDNSSDWLKGYPKEQTGIYPPLGSRFFDIDRVPTWYYNSGSFFGNRFTSSGFNNLSQFVGKLELHDPSALSMHLFSLGDVYPESKTNQNNIFYTGRNLEDYSIIFKRNKTENNENNNEGYDSFTDLNSPLKLNVSSRKDEDYHVEPIASSNGDKVRFNLMRLTDVTLDMLFNEVDYENYKVGDNSTELSDVALGETSLNAGINPLILIKSFPQAGLHNVDVKVGTAHNDADKLNVTSTDWFWSNPITSSAPYNYYIYYYAGILNVLTYVGLVSAATGGVITFTGSIDQSVDVQHTVLYVQIHHNTINTSSKNTKMLLTKDSTVPYFPETTEAVKHNYNKTAIFANSNLSPDNKNHADDTFNTTESYSARSYILKTPIFKSTLGDTEFVHNRLATTLATPAEASHFRMNVNANVSGNTITLTDGDSKLTQFFDTHIKTRIGVNAANSVHTWYDITGSTGAHLDASDTNLFTVRAGNVASVSTGTKVNFRGTIYTIIKLASPTTFRVSPNHNSTNSDLTTTIETAIYEATGSNSFFIQISGLTTDTYDNRLYKVTNVTDTVLTLTDMAGGAANMTTQNGVDITLFSFYAKGSSLAGVGAGNPAAYNSQWVQSINGVDEPSVYSVFANNIIPHRAFYDGEDRLDYKGLDTIVAKFHNVPQMASKGGYAMLTPEVTNIRGAYCSDILNVGEEKIVDYRLGTHSGNTQRWNKGVFIKFNSASQGILSENYSFGCDQYSHKIYGGEIFFKPYLTYDSSDTVADTTLGSDEKMLKYDIVSNWGSGTNTWINYCNNLTGYYFYSEGANDKELHKIISHEINRTEPNVFRHLIKIDNTGNLGSNEILRLMRINQVCMYDFTPNTISLNKPYIKYTKVCDANRMQSEGSDATRYSAEDKDTTNAVNQDGQGMVLDTTREGVKSMYVLIDPDGNINTDFLETRNLTDANYGALTSSAIKMSATDGVNKFITSVSKKGSAILEFSNIKKLLGTPSFGSTFTITVNKSPGFRPDTACIGSSFKIVDELEKVIDDAFTINDITYTKDTEADTYFGAFNFTGQSLYSATNNLLSYKNKEILVDGEEIKIVDKEDSKKYRDIILSSKDSTYSITSINNNISLFDNFDEVIVIGDGVRGIARNPIDTSNSNRTVKSKEIYDYSILDQKQANLKAVQYLDVFNSANTSIEIEVADNVPFLKPGQIIELEFSEQNIPRGDYLVIEIEKEFGSPTKFTLSEYNKDLAGTFATLMGEIRNLQGFTKQKVYTTTTIPRTKRDKVNIKFVKATGTLTSNVTTTSTIGFGYTIGFDSEVGV